MFDVHQLCGDVPPSANTGGHLCAFLNMVDDMDHVTTTSHILRSCPATPSQDDEREDTVVVPRQTSMTHSVLWRGIAGKNNRCSWRFRHERMPAQEPRALDPMETRLEPMACTSGSCALDRYSEATSPRRTLWELAEDQEDAVGGDERVCDGMWRVDDPQLREEPPSLRTLSTPLPSSSSSSSTSSSSSSSSSSAAARDDKAPHGRRPWWRFWPLRKRQNQHDERGGDRNTTVTEGGCSTGESFDSVPHSKRGKRERLRQAAAFSANKAGQNMKRLGHGSVKTSKRAWSWSSNMLRKSKGKLRQSTSAAMTTLKKQHKTLEQKTTDLLFQVPLQPSTADTRHGIITHSSFNERPPETNTWKGVSRHQLRALYAAVQLSQSTTPSQQRCWIDAALPILSSRTDRRDTDDPIRQAALDGNAVLTCLRILQRPCHDDNNVTVPTLRLLQELCLNRDGVRTFAQNDGPRIVLDSLERCCQAARAHNTPENNASCSTDGDCLDALKATYRLLFATCVPENDCTGTWYHCGIAKLPLETLQDASSTFAFSSDPVYAGLALGVLRIVCARVKDSVLLEEAQTYASLAVQQLQQHENDSWVAENALAVLASVQIQHPELVETISPPWDLIVRCCQEHRKEGHVLGQGLAVLRSGCSGCPQVRDKVLAVGGADLFSLILPPDHDIQTERLLLTTIELKQMLKPFDFEGNEMQRYLRTPRYNFVYNTTTPSFRLTTQESLADPTSHPRP